MDARREERMSDTAVAVEVGTSQFAVVNGVRLHYVEAGSGPLVVLLAGFPQFWYAWRRQIPALAAAGHRVIAVDPRGYNLSDKPKGVRSYGVEVLADDVAALVRRLGDSAVVIGHDWGGVIAWRMGARHAGLVDRLVVINAPHPAAFARELRSPSQLLRSSYALFFQLPWLPERLLRTGDFALIERVLRHDPVRRGAFTDEDIRRHKEALARPGALTAMLNYYRAVRLRPRGVVLSTERQRVEPPVMVIWGDRDPYLRVELSRGLDRWVRQLRVEHIPDASHWVMADAPDRVNDLLLDFLGAPTPSPT
jgi:pimeloyl-ACP methyl ester carboxylesterase